MLVNMYVLLVPAQHDDQQGIYLQENTFTGKIILFSGKRGCKIYVGGPKWNTGGAHMRYQAKLI